MSFVSRGSMAGFALAISFSQTAFAGSLAQEVGEEILDLYRGVGLLVSNDPVKTSGDSVTWENIVVSLPAIESAPLLKGQLSWAYMTATDNGDQTVSITYANEFSARFEAGEKAPVFTAKGTMAGLEYLVSGEAGNRTHDSKMTSVQMEISTDDGSYQGVYEMNDLAGYSVYSGTDTRHLEGEYFVGQTKLTQTQINKQGKTVTSTHYQDMKTTFEMDRPEKLSLEGFVKGQVRLSAVSSIGATISRTEFEMEKFAGTVEANAENSNVILSLQDGSVKMDGGGTNAKIELRLTSMPLPPFSFEMDGYTIGVQFPFQKTDLAQDAAYVFDLQGLKLSDTLWGMVDPTGLLPRDKARLKMDVGAKVKWLVDVLNGVKNTAQPMEVENVTLNDLTLEIAGAKLHGTGDLAIDNTKIPLKPVGAFDLDLKGGIGLLGKLTELGLVQKEQQQMLTMFSGLFATPGGDGDDHLKTKIELTEDGGVIVNGNQIQ